MDPIKQNLIMESRHTGQTKEPNTRFLKADIIALQLAWAAFLQTDYENKFMAHQTPQRPDAASGPEYSSSWI